MNRMQTSLAAFAGTALLAATSFATTPPAPPVARPAPPMHRPAPPTAGRPLPPRMRPAPPPADQATDHHRGDHRGDHWRDHDHNQDGGVENREHSRAHDAAWRQADQRHRDEMKKSRASRRKARRAALEKKWGNKTLQSPQVHSEMQTHSWRVARLQRLRTLAQEDNRQDLVTRIDQLEKEEQSRHDKVMAQYRYKGAQQ